MRERRLAHRVFHTAVGGLIPMVAFVGIVSVGLSLATMLPLTARAHGGCTQCVHDINHWTCGASTPTTSSVSSRRPRSA